MSGDKGNKRGGDDRDRPGNKKSKVRLNPPQFSPRTLPDSA